MEKELLSPPPPPFPLLYFSLPTILSFTQVTVIWKQCTPKAGVGAVYTFTFRYWSPCEKFPGEHHVKLWDGTKLLRFAESASSNIVSYSGFIWLNGSITLIRAGTERCDIVRFSKVTTKYLASGTGSYESNELCEVCVSIQIHQSAYRDQTNIPVRGRVVVLNCQRSHTLIGGFESTRIPQMPLVEIFALVMLRKLVFQLQDRFSREILEGLSSHSDGAWIHI